MVATWWINRRPNGASSAGWWTVHDELAAMLHGDGGHARLPGGVGRASGLRNNAQRGRKPSSTCAAPAGRRPGDRGAALVPSQVLVPSRDVVSVPSLLGTRDATDHNAGAVYAADRDARFGDCIAARPMA